MTVPAAVLVAAAPATAGWVPVRGTVADVPYAAAADGARILVASGTPRRLAVTTITGTRVTGRQVLSSGGQVAAVSLVRRADGSAVAVWDQGGSVVAAFRRASALRFGARRVVSDYPGRAGKVPVVAAGPGGTVVAAWWGGPAGGQLGIWAAELRADGTWTAPIEVTAGTYPQSANITTPVGLNIASGSDGRFAVIWRQAAGAPRQERVATAVRDASGAWGTPVPLGQGVVDALQGDLAIALTAAGGTVAAWPHGRAVNGEGVVEEECIAAVTVPAGGVAQAPEDLDCAASTSHMLLRAVAAADGSVHLAWRRAPYPTADPASLTSRIGSVRWNAETHTWGAPLTRVAPVVGYATLQSFRATSDGRVVLVTELDRLGRVVVQVLGADGRERNRVIRRYRQYRTVRTFVLAGRPRVLLLGPGTSGPSPAFPAHLLTLPATP